MITSRTYLLRNQIHDLVKFFQANRNDFMIPEVLEELRGTQDQKDLMLKIFELLSEEISLSSLDSLEETSNQPLGKTLETKKNTSKKVKAEIGDKPESN